MSSECGREFAEELLTGYLDGVLTQGDRQRVRLHLESCPHCSRLVEEMSQTREATMTTRFELPADDQWSEAPRGAASRVSLGLGWILLIAWTIGILGLVVGHLLSDEMGLTEKLLIFGGLSGIVLVFVSVLIDRLKTMGGDRYMGVER